MGRGGLPAIDPTFALPVEVVERIKARRAAAAAVTAAAEEEQQQEQSAP